MVGAEQKGDRRATATVDGLLMWRYCKHYKYIHNHHHNNIIYVVGTFKFMQTVFSYTLLDCVSLILWVPMGVRCVALRIPYPIHYTCVVHIFSSFHSVSCSFCLTKTIIVQTKIIQSSHTNAFVCDDLYIAVSVQATRHMHTYSLVPMSNNIVFCWCRWFI